MSNKTLGKFGEDLAREYLQARGYQILEGNFRNKIGEIDLIALDGQTVCFVEVKARQSLVQGWPYEAVNPRKIRKLSQLAMAYLKYKYHSVEIPSRFDVISILQDKTGTCDIQYFKNAFDSAY
jgi:putative endonuclease